jgi:hypothetical protein
MTYSFFFIKLCGINIFYYDVNDRTVCLTDYRVEKLWYPLERHPHTHLLLLCHLTWILVLRSQWTWHRNSDPRQIGNKLGSIMWRLIIFMSCWLSNRNIHFLNSPLYCNETPQFHFIILLNLAFVVYYYPFSSSL